MSQAFNKNQGKPAQKKQLIILSVLGVVLIGAWAHFGLSHTPQSADAQTTDSGAPGDANADALPKQPLDAMKELAQDPTRNLLRGTHDADADLEQTPYNPFVIDEKLRLVLSKPQPAAPIINPIPEPSIIPAPPLPVPSVAPVINVDAIKLQGIVRDAKHKYAIVNGAIVKVGTTVGDLRIVDILDDRILVVPVSDPDMTPTEIIEKGRLK